MEEKINPFDLYNEETETGVRICSLCEQIVTQVKEHECNPKDIEF